MVADGFGSKYPGDTSVHIHASGNSFRTRLTRLNCGAAAGYDIGRAAISGAACGMLAPFDLAGKNCAPALLKFAPTPNPGLYPYP